MGYTVKLNVYDLSNGMAAQFSPMFLGKRIDGIWHTGVVLYGYEFYFGGGICKDRPNQTPYGTPVREVDMGQTEIDESVSLRAEECFLPKPIYLCTQVKFQKFQG